jgi:hypothetical protein
MVLTVLCNYKMSLEYIFTVMTICSCWVSPTSEIDGGGAQHIGGAVLTHKASLLG